VVLEISHRSLKRWPGVKPKPVDVRFVKDEAAMGQA
jgi:hypothetical protein